MFHLFSTKRNSLNSFLLFVLVSCLSFSAYSLDGVQVSRYSTLSPVPPASQVNPLDAVIQVSLPRQQVSTVGDAINYLLLRSGYRLYEQQGDDVKSILSLPLPEVHRQLGPYSVQTALGVLMGQSYSLNVDHAHRQIQYKTDSKMNRSFDQGTDRTTPLSPSSHTSPVPLSGAAGSAKFASVAEIKATSSDESTK